MLAAGQISPGSASTKATRLTDLKCQDKHRHHFALCAQESFPALFDKYLSWITALAGKGEDRDHPGFVCHDWPR